MCTRNYVVADILFYNYLLNAWQRSMGHNYVSENLICAINKAQHIMAKVIEHCAIVIIIAK